MSCKLKCFVIFLKFFTCLLISRPYYYYAVPDLTMQSIREEEPYGEPSLTVTDIVFGLW